MLTDFEIHKKRNWVATVATLVVILLLSFFVWRVLSLARQIQTGEINPTSFDFSDQSMSSLRIAAIPISDQPSNVVSTDDQSLGRKDAPVTIVEFADFQCPYSREASFVMRELALKYPEKINFIYRDFPLSDVHPLARKAAEASECAADQGKFWEYHDKLFQNQSDLSQERFYQFAAELNLNISFFRSCLDSGTYKEEVENDYQDGLKAGVRGTPTFFINGTKIQGAIPKDIFEKLIGV
ncbi:DsbA family protein [Candidatus Uhrbacteria bacterium]|nr:DsbA family protein [Candidatus Uhrbacteria bacterium]